MKSSYNLLNDQYCATDYMLFLNDLKFSHIFFLNILFFLIKLPVYDLTQIKLFRHLVRMRCDKLPLCGYPKKPKQSQESAG